MGSLKIHKWNLSDTFWQLSAVILLIIGWGQSRFASLDQITWKESNPLLVSITNTPLKVDIYMLICIVGNVLIAYLLTKKWRKGWQIVTILAELYCVLWAFYDGVGLNFSLFQY